ncbi:hypothetical protein AB685_11725 [Bacillus sp. LL01]|nr:hypothetical protein AB685_11725 [Bacillus sp. LL01]
MRRVTDRPQESEAPGTEISSLAKRQIFILTYLFSIWLFSQRLLLFACKKSAIGLFTVYLLSKYHAISPNNQEKSTTATDITVVVKIRNSNKVYENSLSQRLLLVTNKKSAIGLFTAYLL